MMVLIHPQARTTPAVRAEIARSADPTSIVAKRYGVSDETVRKWRKRGEHACQDRSSRPTRLPWRATEQERAIICAVRRATGLPLDDLTFVLRYFLPHLNRDSIYRALKSEGINQRPSKASPTRGKCREGATKYDLGVVRIKVEPLPNVRTADGQIRKRFLHIAIGHCSRFLSLALYDVNDSMADFLTTVRRAFPFEITQILIDTQKTDQPRTCLQDKVINVDLSSHAALDILLASFAAAYNEQPQRHLRGLSPLGRIEREIELNPLLASSLASSTLS